MIDSISFNLSKPSDIHLIIRLHDDSISFNLSKPSDIHINLKT